MSRTTRDDLLAAAERLFAEHGFAAVGIREIAAEAGANVSAIKYHFGSKRDLYLAALKAAVSQPVIERTWDLLAEPPTDRERAGTGLVSFFRAWLVTMMAQDDVSSCTRLVVREALRPSEGLDLIVHEFGEPHEERLTAYVQALAPERSSSEQLVAVRAILGQLVHYLVFRAFVEHRMGRFRPAEVLRIADDLVRFTLRGLSCSEPFIADALARAPIPDLPEPLTSED